MRANDRPRGRSRFQPSLVSTYAPVDVSNVNDLHLFMADEDGEQSLTGVAVHEAATDRDEELDAPEDALPFRADDQSANSIFHQCWGLILPKGSKLRQLGAVRELIAARAQVMKLRPERVFVAEVPATMSRDECTSWIDDVLGAVPESTRPRYLFILGDLDEVPFSLQRELAKNHFVGRVGFDTDDGYVAYIEKLLRWERTGKHWRRARTVFTSALDGTPAIHDAQRNLVNPLRSRIARIRAAMDESDGRPSEVFRTSALVDLDIPRGGQPNRLLERAAAEIPTLLFSVSHGAAKQRRWTYQDQLAMQGALSLGDGSRISAADVSEGAFLPGGLWLYFACFGAGTPATSVYSHWLHQMRGDTRHVLRCLPQAGESPFLAALPKAALANPNGPLAVLAHVDMVWSYAYRDYGAETVNRYERFLEPLRMLVEGSRAGVALHKLRQAVSEVESEIAFSIDSAQEEAFIAWSKARHLEQRARAEAAKRAYDLEFEIRTRHIGHRMMLRADLDSFCLLGDPAARMPLGVD